MTEHQELRWERLNSVRFEKKWYQSSWETYRSKIPGGWLVLVRSEGESPHGMTFYPDPDHRWSGGSLS